MRVLLLVCLLAVLCLPMSYGVDLEEQAREMGLEDLEEAGEVYTGEVDLTQGLDLGEIFRTLYHRGQSFWRRQERKFSAAACSFWW